MTAPESTLIALMIILALTLFIPDLFKRFRIPIVTLIILIGSIAGPNGLKYIQFNEIISFFGFLGMTFLMLMAGLETKVTQLNDQKKNILILSFFNGILPFFAGLFLIKSFGYSWTTSFLVGTIFISSSIAIIAPLIREINTVNINSPHIILATVIISDIISLIFLGVVLQNIQPITNLPFSYYFIILITSIVLLFLFLPKITRYFLKKRFNQKGDEKALRYVIVIVMAILIYFSWLGVHPILAAFLGGLVFASTLNKRRMKSIDSKLHIIGNGIFVPIFFFIVGMELDLKILTHLNTKNLIIPALILTSIASKILFSYIGGRFIKMPKKDSLTFGIISITQLTTTLAVAYAAKELNLIDSTLTTAIILLAIITTILGPFLASYINRTKT